VLETFVTKLVNDCVLQIIVTVYVVFVDCVLSCTTKADLRRRRIGDLGGEQRQEIGPSRKTSGRSATDK
jgi:hypothetical protein